MRGIISTASCSDGVEKPDTCSPAVQCTQPPIIHAADQSNQPPAVVPTRRTFQSAIIAKIMSPVSVNRDVACCSLDCLLNLRRMAQPGRVPEPSEVSCPQLAAAQWWEAAGRGISCSNYVGCIATLFVIQSMPCTPSIIHLQSLASIFNFGVHFI